MAESLEHIDPQFHSLKRLDLGSSAISDMSVAIPCVDNAPLGSGVLSEIDALFRQMLGASEELLVTQASVLSAEDREKIAAMHRGTQRLRGLFSELRNSRQPQADASHTASDGRNSLTTADRLAFVLSAAKLGDWSWDPVTDVMELSARAAEIFEVPAGSRFTRTELRELLHENDRERARLAAEYSARTQTDYDIEYQINLRSGGRRWVAAKGRPLLAADGRLCGMLGLVQDITQRKQAEEALKDTRGRLDATLGAAEIGTWTWNLRSNRVIADKNLAHMFFGPETDVSEGPIENFLEMIHPEDRDRAQADITAAIQSVSGELETDYRLVSPDGRMRWVTVRGKVQRDASGLPVQFPGVLIDITERKRQEAALAELSRRMEDQARLFDATLSNIADLAYAFDRDKRVIYANKALLDLWGVSLDQAVGKNCYELNYPPELARQLEAQMQKVFDTKKRVKDVTFYAGEYHEYIYSPAFAPDGSVTAMVGTTRIITERKRAEAVAERHRRVLQQIAEDGPLETILEELVRALEVEAPEMLGSVLLLDEEGTHLRHGAAPSLPAAYNQSIDGVEIGPEVGSCGTAAWSKQPVYVTDIRTDPLWARYKGLAEAHGLRACWSTPIFSSQGSVLGTFAMYYREPRKPNSKDLAIVETATRTAAVAIERKRVEKALRDSEARFRNMADNAPVMVWVTEPDGRCTFLSKSWYEFTGQSPETGLGFGWADATHPDDRASVLESFLKANSGRKEFRTEFRLLRNDGEYRWTLVAATPRVSADGRFLGFIGSAMDITERKQAEVALREAKDAAEAAGLAKDRFLAVLSHELRTPLTPVLMTITALESDTELPFAVRDDLAMIRRNVELETKLIDDLLDLSRITSGKLRLKLESVDLNEAIRQVCEICSSQILEKNIRLDVELNSESAHVIADPARLQQALWNVLKNAVKFTPEHRSITVTTGRSASGRVRVQVRDSGIGIERDKLSRIFDAFEQGDPKITRQFGGLGLGLAISKALVEMHHGSIWAESEGFGRGSTFTVELPLKEAASESAPATPESEAARQPASLRLLLVEDHVDTARTLGRLLRLSGYTVKSAGTITAALELAEKEPFDVLVSDLGLPDGTGYELMQQIRERYAMRGIAMSGFGMEEDLRRSKEAGFSEHLVKPLSIPQLRQALNRVGEQL